MSLVCSKSGSLSTKMKALFQLLLIAIYSFTDCKSLTIQNQESYCEDENVILEGNYDYHTLFKTALYLNEENIFNIKHGGFMLNAGSKLACIPVTYELLCTNQSKLCHTLNKTSWPFLWTSFDTTDTLGNFFLHYAIGGLRVFGFEWENDCNAYQTSVTITLQLQSVPNDIDTSEHDTYTAVCQSLMQLSKLVN